MARRKTEKFLDNPFMQDLSNQVKIGHKSVFARETKDGEKLAIINPDTGEIKAQGGIFAQKEVDKTEFIKIYSAGVSAVLGLKNAGKNVFQLIFSELAGKNGVGKAEVVLNYDALALKAQAENKKIISKSTFFRGIRECIDAKIIADSYTANVYFINPTFIFNGNRLTMVKEYWYKEEIETAKTFEAELKKRGQQELPGISE